MKHLAGKVSLLGLVLGLIVAASAQLPLFAEPAAATVTQPSSSGSTISPLNEYAADVLNDVWDMSQPTDLAYPTDHVSNINNPRFENGFYVGTLPAGDGRERINLMIAGAPNNTAMRVGKIGYTYPINADKYRYLTFRMYSSNNKCNSGLVQWFADDSYSTGVMGVSNGFLVPPHNPPSGLPASDCLNGPYGWHVYTVDLKNLGIQQGGQPWEGTIRELILKPFAGDGAAGAQFKLDWARLTEQNPLTARPYEVRWTGGSGTAEIYASPGNKTRDDHDILLANNISASLGEADIQAGLLPPGDYYIAVVDSSGTAWSDGPLTVLNKPAITIKKPSMTSGQEYASSVLGDAWDMHDVDDANSPGRPSWQKTCLINESFQNGIYTAVVPNPICNSGGIASDPIMYLGNMPNNPPLSPIDTSKFRYVSFRLLIDGNQDVTHGWVARFGWWRAGIVNGESKILEDVVMSRDIILHDGWNEYNIDLWVPDVVDEVHRIQRNWVDSNPNQLRFDPVELTQALLPGSIQVDWVKLNAIDEVGRGSIFPIIYNFDHAANLTFYYDTDTNAGNGRTEIGTAATGDSCSTSSTPLPGGHRVFLPAVGDSVSAFNSLPDGAGCYPWNTSSVSPGSYYICIQSDDGFSSIYSCSEAPVVVR